MMCDCVVALVALDQDRIEEPLNASESSEKHAVEAGGMPVYASKQDDHAKYMESLWDAVDVREKQVQ